MTFDFNGAQQAVMEENREHRHKKGQASNRAVELHNMFIQFVLIHGGKCHVEADGNHVEAGQNGQTDITVTANLDGTYSVSCRGFDPAILAPPGGYLSDPMSEQDMLKVLVRWYHQLR